MTDVQLRNDQCARPRFKEMARMLHHLTVYVPPKPQPQRLISGEATMPRW